MASFWDEIQKQYENAENRYRDNLNVGVNMLNNKANQIQQSYANAMGEATQRAGLFAQSLNLPAQFAQMLANREDTQEARRIQGSQFDADLAFKRLGLDETIRSNKENEGINATKANNESTMLGITLQEIKDKKTKETKAYKNEQSFASNMLNGYTNPQVVSFINAKRAEGLSDTAILDLVYNNGW